MTTQTVPASKPAGELEPGDYVMAEDLHPDAEGVGEVLIAKTFGAAGREAVSVMVSYGDRFEPDYCRLTADMPVRIASDEAVQAAKDTARRDLAAERLRELAVLIGDKKLPLPGRYHDMTVRFGFGSDAGLVDEVAKALGVETTDRFGQYAVEWPPSSGDGELTAVWSAYSPKKAAPKPDPTGHGFSREPDEVTPEGRIPAHDGFADKEGLTIVPLTDGGALVTDPDEPGLIVGDTADEQRDNAYAAYERDEAEAPASGLTSAADQSRGKLAGTTPVVTYFSFGHGQTDPRDGKRLLDHYATVVAPTYEACREAMLASRFGRAWSFDYLAGTPRATEWIPRWTEHEVIVAPGTDKALAESALLAARDLVTDPDGPECTPTCDAQQADPSKATGLARGWHSGDCPVPVHHHVADGGTACGIPVADLPAAHGYATGEDWDVVDCKSCRSAYQRHFFGLEESAEHYPNPVDA